MSINHWNNSDIYSGKRFRLNRCFFRIVLNSKNNDYYVIEEETYLILFQGEIPPSLCAKLNILGISNEY